MTVGEEVDLVSLVFRDFLKKNHLERKRIVIDIESETIELDTETVIENIRRSREEY